MLYRTWQQGCGHYEVVESDRSTVWKRADPLFRTLDDMEAKDSQKLIAHEDRQKRKLDDHATAMTRPIRRRRRGPRRLTVESAEDEQRKQMYEATSPFDFLIGKQVLEEEETEAVFGLWQTYNPGVRMGTRDKADRLESWLMSLKQQARWWENADETAAV